VICCCCRHVLSLLLLVTLRTARSSGKDVQACEVVLGPHVTACTSHIPPVLAGEVPLACLVCCSADVDLVIVVALFRLPCRTHALGNRAPTGKEIKKQSLPKPHLVVMILS